jgi:hypothetical protein
LGGASIGLRLGALAWARGITKFRSKVGTKRSKGKGKGKGGARTQPSRLGDIMRIQRIRGFRSGAKRGRLVGPLAQPLKRSKYGGGA